MITFILPAYNEAPGLEGLVRKISAAAGTRPYRVLVFDDGSKDGTGDIARALGERYPVELLTHRVNRGLGETIRDAFEWAAEHSAPDDVIVRMDADDTHDPSYVPAMLQRLDDGYDVVIASRFRPGGGEVGLSAYRRLISRCANLLMKMVFPIRGVRDYSCGFRAYRAAVIQDALAIYGNDFIELKGIGFTCTVEKLVKLQRLRVRFNEVGFVLRYDRKMSTSKMLSSLTTAGYLILMLKNIYPWGPAAKRWARDAKALAASRAAGRTRGA